MTRTLPTFALPMQFTTPITPARCTPLFFERDEANRETMPLTDRVLRDARGTPASMIDRLMARSTYAALRPLFS